MTAAIAKKKKVKTKSPAGKEKPVEEQRIGERKIEERKAALKESMEREENAFEQKEAMEKEKKSGKEAAKKKAAKKPIDVKLAAAIAIIAVISVTAFFLSQPRQADVSDFWKWNEPAEEKVKMIIIYSDLCADCEKDNSMQLLFQQNNIPFAVNLVEQKSAEGQKMIKELGLVKLPAFLIDGRTIKDSWTVNTKSGSAPLKETLRFYVNKGEAKFGKDVFVFYEIALDNKPHVNLLLNEPCGTAEHMIVTYFADTYDPATIAASADMTTLREMFDDHNVEFVYAYLPTSASQSMQQMFTQDTIETAPKHLVCASSLGTEKFMQIEQAVYNKYCDVNSAQSYQEKLFRCNDSNHFSTPVLGEEMAAIKAETGIKDNTQLSLCLYNYKDPFDATKALAEKWRINKSPIAVINCTFETHPAIARSVICAYKPDNLFCRK